jgi:predicted lipoprotein
MRPSTPLIAGLVAGALLLSACSSDDGGSAKSTTTDATAKEDVGKVLQGLADDVIVPSYVALGSSLQTLEDATTSLCADPSDVALAGARAAWGSAEESYQQTRPVAVGPAEEARLMSDIGFAARPTVIDDLLASGDPVDAKALADEGSAARGIYASEIALFGEGSDALTTAEGARRCAYAASVATLSSQAAEPVVEAWTDGDATKQLVAGLDGGPQSSVDELVNTVTQRLNEIDAMGLRDMAEAKGIDDLDPDRLGGPANQQLASRKALMEGIFGAIGDGDTGISALVGAHSTDTRDRLVAANEKAYDAMADLPGSIAAAFDEPAKVDAASKAVQELKVLLSTEVASQLGVTITFSDSDGDS